MTTQKRKTPEISSTSAAVAVEDPPEQKAESAETSEGNVPAAAEPASVATPSPDGGDETPPEPVEPDTEIEPDTDVEPSAADVPPAKGPSDAEPSTAAMPNDQSESAEQAALAALTALSVLTERISALEAAFALQQIAIADVGDSVAGRIAAEVERVTTDELVDTKRNLALAAGSMAHLALGITESAENVNGELGPDSITALLHSFRAEVDNVLLQLGYAPLDTRVGERFDPNRHRSLRRIPTDDVALDRLIARVIRDGYRSENTKRILVYSDVEVHRYQSANSS